MSYKAIIFDMDGTIITSENAWKRACHHLLTKYTNLDTQECETVLSLLKGGSLLTSCTYIAKTFNTTATIEELMQEKKDFAFNEFHKELAFIEGFDNFHKKLLLKNLKSAIATNASLPEVTKILEHLPLKTFFNEHIYTVDHVFKIAKPKPDVYLYAAQQLDIDPAYCIAIEDSAHGINAAKAAGMYCIGINTGKNRSAIAHAHEIIEHYDEIDLEKLLNNKKST